MIRAAESDADRALCARIFNTLNPASPISAADFYDDPCLLLHGDEGYAVVKRGSLEDAAFAMVVEGSRSTFHVALEDDRIVGFATLSPYGLLTDTLEHELTGVLRSHRRRGIGEALKRAQIAWAAAAGYRRLVTGTQTGNKAMRSLNLKLGYRERLDTISVKGPLQ